jgi:N-acetylglucosaminyldiphosphoundecaprenol N-acetyl-beta-D-mannosaminyltransferase
VNRCRDPGLRRLAGALAAAAGRTAAAGGADLDRDVRQRSRRRADLQDADARAAGAAAAGTALAARNAGLEIAGTFAGDATPAGDAETVAAVRRAGRCDLLFVAYGARRQERWIDRNLSRVDAGVAIGVGGVLDFMSGRVPRAPAVVRRAGLDWLFRLLQQPGRFRRQATTIPPFLALALAEALRRRTGALTGPPGAAQAGSRELSPRKRT